MKYFETEHIPKKNTCKINTFTPKSDKFQISPAASPEILHHTCFTYSVLKLTWTLETYYTG